MRKSIINEAAITIVGGSRQASLVGFVKGAVWALKQVRKDLEVEDLRRRSKYACIPVAVAERVCSIEDN